MLGATSAGDDQLLAQSGAGAMRSNACIGSGDALVSGEVLQRLLAQIDSANQVRVIGPERVEDATQAGADFVLDFWRRCDGRFQVTAPDLQGFHFRAATAVVVDDRVAQNAIEPPHHGLVAL